MIDWEKILKIDAIVFDSLESLQIYRRMGGLVQTIFWEKPNISPNKFKSKILFFKSMQREDYNKNFKQLSELSKDKEILDIKYLKNANLRLYPLYIILKYMPLLIYTNFSFNLLKMIYLILCQVKYLEVAERVYKNDFSYLVVFADMQAMDNMLCQIAKRKGIKTVTLQHGLYVDYEKNFNVNIVNYKHHIADYFLSWGKDTNDLIKKYHKNPNLFICGKPLPVIEERSIQNYFTVVFDQNIFHDYNKKLLEIAYKIAEDFQLKINLRLHPNNKIDWYSIDDKIVLFNKKIQNSSFIVGHTTSLLYELMRLGIPSYKLKSEVPSNILDEDFKFSTVEELEIKIAQHKEENFDFSNYAKKYIEYIGDESLAKYKKIFKRLENGEL